MLPTPTNTMAMKMKKALLHDPSAVHDFLPVCPPTLSDWRLGGRAECVSRARGVIRQRRQWLVCTTDIMLPPAIQNGEAANFHGRGLTTWTMIVAIVAHAARASALRGKSETTEKKLL